MSNVVPFKRKGGESGNVEQLILPPASAHAYAELAVTTNFSFLRGASHSKELVRQAVALGLTAIGIADRNSVAGVVKAYAEAEELNAQIRELNE
jgi:error-prone DNA polymerase